MEEAGRLGGVGGVGCLDGEGGEGTGRGGQQRHAEGPLTANFLPTSIPSLRRTSLPRLQAHVLFNKNMKRLADPRGEGQDGEHGRNVMSMF